MEDNDPIVVRVARPDMSVHEYLVWVEEGSYTNFAMDHVTVHVVGKNKKMQRVTFGNMPFYYGPRSLATF